MSELYELAEKLEKLSVRPPVRSEGRDNLANISMRFAELYVDKIKYFKSESDKETFAILLGEEIYLRILKNKPVYNMVGYVRRALPGMWKKWGDLHCPFYNEFERAAVSKYTPGELSRCTTSESYNSIDKLSTIELIENLFYDANKYIRYSSKWSSKVARLNAHVSFVLSIRNGKYISFHLTRSDSDLCRLIYNTFKLQLQTIISSIDKPLISSESMDKFAAMEILSTNGQFDSESW